LRRTVVLDFIVHCTYILEAKKMGRRLRMFSFDEANVFGKDAMDKALKSYSTTSKGFQAIATETTDYTKKSFETAVAHMQAMMGAKSIETAMEMQKTFAKSSMESYMSEMKKLGEMYTDLAKTAYKPVESAVATTTEVVKTKAEKAASAVAA